MPFQGPKGFDVESEHPAGYQRSAFRHWVDADRDGCDTRAELLLSSAVRQPSRSAGCRLLGGVWVSPYDRVQVEGAGGMAADHVVPLAEAWRSGAWKWDAARRKDFANDMENLTAVSARINKVKSDRDVAHWLPAYGVSGYVDTWVAVKRKWGLSVDTQEAKALERLTGTPGT